MYTLCVRVSRHVFPQGAYKLIHCTIPMCKITRAPGVTLCSRSSEFSPPEFDACRTPVTQALKYILEEKTSGSIRWDIIHNKLLKDVKNPTTKILQACLRLGELKSAVSYCEYITSSGHKFDKIDWMIFSKVLIQDKTLIPPYKDALLLLFENLKEEMFSSEYIWNYMLEVFLEVPECYNKICERLVKQDCKEFRTHCHLVIVKALQLYHYDVAVYLMEKYAFKPDENFLRSYIEVCIQKLKENKFSVALITRLVEILEKKVMNFSCNDFKSVFNVLLDALQKYDSEYDWSFTQSIIDPNTASCSSCKHTLHSQLLTEKEYEGLKQYFLNRFFENKSIYINTNTNEFQSFIRFLQTSQPYNIVLDGLNLIYKKKNIGVQLSNRYLKYFTEKGFQVLTIGRIHSKATLLKAYKIISKQQRAKVQFFFTANVSDDDVFVLYAALHGGLNTYFLTGDNLGHYVPEIKDEMRVTYLKWQMTHQYLITKDLEMSPPLTHCNLPQVTARPGKENSSFVWHLSNSPGKSGFISRGAVTEWYCLQATKKIVHFNSMKGII